MILKGMTWRKLLICVAAILLLSFGIRNVLQDPKVAMLVSEQGAEWVRYPAPFRLNAYFPESRSTLFRYRFHLDSIPETAVMTFRVFDRAVFRVNDQPLLVEHSEINRWKRPISIDLASVLMRGDNEISVHVSKENGPPAMLGYCDRLNIRSGEDWEASEDGQQWSVALPVDEIKPFPLSRTFPRSDQALRSLLPFFLPIFFITVLLTLRASRVPEGPWRMTLSPGDIRWLLLGAWLLMGVNNFWKIPIPFGMDYPGHTEYISYIATYWYPPLATEGWQMFQPPLFYYLEAILFRLFLLFCEPDTVIRILKLFPFLCGALQVEICYRSVRYVYPREETSQVIGTLLGGLLPMNFYMSQSIGNEPLAACLTALIVFWVCRINSDNGDVPRLKRETGMIMGFILGLALLSKPTPILIVPPLLLFIYLHISQRTSRWVEVVTAVTRFTLLFFATAFFVTGWYYIRNYLEMGHFFIGGWDTLREIVWWMDPGYRTPRQCYAFGESLIYPVLSSIHGFGDALYSTLWMDGNLSSLVSGEHLPWNPNFMLSCALLSLLPTALIITGIGVAVFSRDDGPQRIILRFSFCCVLTYLAAIFYIFLKVPILSSAKASYALGLTPCFALLAAKGYESWKAHPVYKALACGIFVCWAIASYLTYLII